MIDVCSTNCCGVSELDGIAGMDPVDILKEAAPDLIRNEYWDTGPTSLNCAFVLFTDTGKQKSASALARFIRAQGLGKVYRTESKRNPNTKNKVGVWIWQMAPKKTLAWFKKYGNEQ